MKPILFNTEMVRAILSGRKTVTRLIIKPQPLMKLSYIFAGHGHGKWNYPSKDDYKYWGDEYKRPCEIPEQEESRQWTPPCHGDDILYVKETCINIFGRYKYRADISTGKLPSGLKWTPSIHMPKEAARIFLHVTNVRVERLQDITADDCEKEGIVAWSKDGKQYKYAPADKEGDYPIWKWSNTPRTPQAAMQRVWDSTIKKSDLNRYGWNANPWVWVIEFERIDKPDGGDTHA